MELSTGEFDSPRGMAAGKLAGLATISLIAQTREGARAYNHSGTTIGTKTRTLGHHDNAMAALSSADLLLADLLDSFDASSVWAWGGRVGAKGFELSQKAPGMGVGTMYRVGNRTSESHKPMGWIKLGDSDVFADAHSRGWARSERRVVDSGLCRVVPFIAAAASSAVLRLYEQRHRLPDNLPLEGLLFKHPVQVLHTASKDLTLSKKYPTQDDKELTVLQMQDRFVEYLDVLGEELEIPGEEMDGIDLLYKVIGLLGKTSLNDPEADLRPIMGWTNFGPHLAYLRHKHKDTPLTSHNSEVLRSSYRWNELDPAGPSGNFWRRLYGKGQAPDPVGDALIAHHIHHAAKGTRAAVRGEAVRDKRIRTRITHVDWSFLALNHRENPPVSNAVPVNTQP